MNQPAYNNLETPLENSKLSDNSNTVSAYVPILAKWIQLDISTVDSVNILDKKAFEDEKEIKIGTVNSKRKSSIYGMLDSFDVEINFTIPFALDPTFLSCNVSETKKTITSYDTDVSIGFLDSTGSYSINNFEKINPQPFKLFLTLKDGFENENIPLFDQIHSNNELIVHHCIRFNSSNGKTIFLRLKVNHIENNVEIVSITENFADKERMKESVSNVKSLLERIFEKTKLKISEKRESRKNKKNEKKIQNLEEDNQTLQDQQNLTLIEKFESL